ncbi:hypothetical protein [Fusobacterium ulcerans]|uniref:hypothetical protein n=1 Tax=Fusobacterium ulcerans TaxID=861 RepID=UPI002E779AEB|nr:hypothetical protein [Fusobacterium ulcerans]MEE0137073.1 hypothetical protein [Fusobacterium ulcerans]
MKSFIKKQIGKIIPYILSVIILFLIGVIFKIQISILISTLSFITSIFTIILEKTWLEDYKNKLDAELETHKAKLSKYTLVTKLQYELEFKIYTEIYELIQLNFQTVAGMVNDIKSNRKRDNHLEIIKKYNETGASVLSNTLKNRPFYQEEIFNSILKIDGINKKICDIYVNFIENSIITEDAEKLATDVGKRLINLSILIRKRIENMKIIEG